MFLKRNWVSPTKPSTAIKPKLYTVKPRSTELCRDCKIVQYTKSHLKNMSNSCTNQPINHSWQSEYSNEASHKVLITFCERTVEVYTASHWQPCAHLCFRQRSPTQTYDGVWQLAKHVRPQWPLLAAKKEIYTTIPM